MPKNFETSLSDLEKIVRKLEGGDLSLEESLKLFEDGVKLSRDCQERLGEAERRIEILMQDEKGNPLVEEITPDDLDAPRDVKSRKRIVFDDSDDDEAPF